MKDWIVILFMIMLIVMFVFVVVALVRRQLDEDHYKRFDLTDAILKNGRVSRDALFEWIGVLSLTLVLFYLTLSEKLTEWFLLGYTGAVLLKGVTHILKGTPTKPVDIDKDYGDQA